MKLKSSVSAIGTGAGNPGMAQVLHAVSVSVNSPLANTVSSCLCSADDDRYGSRGSGKDRDRRPPPSLSNGGFQNGIPTAPRAQREKAASQPSQPTSSNTMPPPPSPSNTETTSTYVPQMTDADLSAIRVRYLGVDKKKRKIRKMNDRKFVFDWDTQDDTAADMPAPPVVQGQGVAQVMFGRGRIAGMDDYQGVRRTGVESQLTDPMERRRAAKNGLDERHWSDKPIQEMKDRDWRIFREDFSIAARGTRLPASSILHSLMVGQAAQSPIPCVLGRSLLFLHKSSRSSIKSATKSRHLFKDRPYRLVCKIAISLGLQRLVRDLPINSLQLHPEEMFQVRVKLPPSSFRCSASSRACRSLPMTTGILAHIL